VQFFKLAIEGLNTPRLIHPDSWAQRVRFHEIGPTLKLLNSGRPVLIVTGHIGGFEATGSVLAVMGYPIHAVARPIDNPLINDWLLGVRERRGMKVISKWESEIERMFGVLEAGEILAIVADQNAGDRGMFVPFFGRLASTHKSLALIAVERDVPIVCGYTRRINPGCRYEVRVPDIIMPEDWADQPDPLYYITARFMRAVEAMVRESPAQYLWMHRRWKSRPRFEKQGKPMPGSIRRKIEALPWMDEPTMQQLLASATDAA
jgi:KDO2-lipid IV(A) lauroyltransferase